MELHISRRPLYFLKLLISNETLLTCSQLSSNLICCSFLPLVDVNKQQQQQLQQAQIGQEETATNGEVSNHAPPLQVS